MQVFDLIAGSGGRGCVVVDSTRRGKGECGFSFY